MRLPLSFSLLAALFAGCAGSNRNVSASAKIPTQLPPNVRPTHYAISITPDAANLRFFGQAEVDINVLKSTDSITLNALDLEFAAVKISADNASSGSPSDIRVDRAAQTATLRFPHPISPGQHRLTIDYTGKINTQAVGFFALDYKSDAGPKRALFTQFEAPDARRFFPCWDEPRFRTPYDLRVVVPRDQVAVSNMPEASRDMLEGGGAAVTFRTTPAMSSYLVFLAVGEFDRITAQAGATEVGIVTRRGAGEQGRWALESAALILPWYNDYFGTPFPLPKLDNVAGPGSSQFFGAMENWGAIFSFERALLIDPALASEERRHSIFRTAAHEMAHQWFGDLVTMAWWDDLWLNEGFASWMESKASAALHPEWETALDRVSGRERAAEPDGLFTTHPIVQRVTTVDQISQAFDSITYQKGAAVIGMLEDYIGEDAWRRGVRAYIKRHSLGNTVTDDLWRAMEAAAGRPVTAIAHDFTRQPGVPLIRVEEAKVEKGMTHITLRQGEFSRDLPDKKPLSWRVPVTAAAGGEPARTLVENGSAKLTVPGGGPLVVNYGQAGYYRTLYTPALIARLTDEFARLRPIDQIGLLADNWELGLAGYQPPEVALKLVDATPTDGNSRLLTRVARIFTSLHRDYDGDAGHQAMLARFAASKLSPALQRLGWAAREGEPSTDRVLRSDLIGALGRLGDAEVVAECCRRFDADDPSVKSGQLREAILEVVAFHADATQWDRLHATAREAKRPLVRSQLCRLLGTARDESLARRALDLSLTDEPGATNSSQILSAVAAWHPDLAFDYALSHREQVDTLIDASSRSRYYARLAATSTNPAMIGKLQDYAKQHLTAENRSAVDRAISTIRDELRVREKQLPQIGRWLETRGAPAAR